MPTSKDVSDYITLDYYDQPLLEIAVVEGSEADRLGRVLQARTLGYWVEDSQENKVQRGMEIWDRVVVRLSRSDLQTSIDLLDGIAVRDFKDRLQSVPLVGAKPAGSRSDIELVRTKSELEAAQNEIERLGEALPTCSECDSSPAVCFGQYEGDGVPQPSCHSCCGHGNEDGWCIPLSDLPETAAAVDANNTRLATELNELRKAVDKLRTMSNSAVQDALKQVGL